MNNRIEAKYIHDAEINIKYQVKMLRNILVIVHDFKTIKILIYYCLFLSYYYKCTRDNTNVKLLIVK